MLGPVAEFIDPDRGDKVVSGIGLSYRPVRAGRYANPMPESTLSHSQGSMNSATGPMYVGLNKEKEINRAEKVLLSF
jgi:hypothetical protein